MRVLVTTVTGPRSNKKYLFKLGIADGMVPQADTVYKPREERPRQHCTLIIFDWETWMEKSFYTTH